MARKITGCLQFGRGEQGPPGPAGGPPGPQGPPGPASKLVWRPQVNQDGLMRWRQSESTETPKPYKIPPGPQGPPGQPGSEYVFEIQGDNLFIVFDDVKQQPSFSINNEGHLIYDIKE